MPKWWAAEYKDKEDQVVVIPGCATNECPVSAITEWSRLVVEEHWKWRLMPSALGDMSELPAKLVLAIELLEIERFKVDEALA